MKQARAEQLAAEVERQFKGRIRATVKERRRLKDGAGFAVSLLLVAGQRRMMAADDDELQGILDAWSNFFAEAS